MTLKLKIQKTNHLSSSNGHRQMGLLRVIRGVILVFAISYFSYIPEGRSVTFSELKEGEVATKDIMVTRDITVEDRSSTETNRKKALERLIPLYEMNGEKTETALNQINDWMVFIRGIRTDFYNRNLTVREIAKEIEATFAIRLNESEIRRLMLSNPFHKFDPGPLLKLIKEKCDQGILASTLGIRKSLSGEIQVRTPGGESRIESIEAFQDLQNMRDDLVDYLSRQKRLDAEDQDIVQRIVMTFVPVTITYSQEWNLEQEKQTIEKVLPVFVSFKKGKVIIRRGDEITAEHVHIVSLISSTEPTKKKLISPFFFLLIFWGMTYILIFRYLQPDGKGIGDIGQFRLNQVIFATLLLSAVFYRVLVYLQMFLLPLIINSIHPQIPFEHRQFFFSLPFGFGALIIGFLFNLPTLMVFSLCNALLAGIICDWSIHVIIFALIGNLLMGIAIEHYQKLKRSTVLKAGFFWLVPVNVLIVFFLSITDINFRWVTLGVDLILAVFSALLSTFLASFMIPLWEVLFKLVTDLKLVEITNLNLPVFREMLEKAPGTYHHSQMVASLSEAIAQEMGLSSLMLRGMALYHDIGKVEAPQYFTENHSVYENPHTLLSPRESTKAIIGHVSAGLERAEKLKLPQKIRNSIARHHGTKVVRYFYEKQASLNREEGTTTKDDQFRYAGPRPQDIEDAIIMLADQIEAAVKSLTAPSDEEIKKVIEEIISKNIEDNQFEECRGMTFMAIKLIANSFFNKLSSIYHQRVTYPGFEFSKGNRKG